MTVLGSLEVRIVLKHVIASRYPFFIPWDKLGSRLQVAFLDV